MKKRELFRRLEISNNSSQKEYVKKLRIYLPFMYSHLDKWLKSMSTNGLHIVHCGMFVFWFERGKPAKKEYFTYGLNTQEGEYDILLRHPNLEKLYAVKSKKSKINSNKTKTHQIIEIDTDKIDIESNVGYIELIKDRNSLYLKYFVRNIIVLLIVALLLVVLLCIK